MNDVAVRRAAACFWPHPAELTQSNQASGRRRLSPPAAKPDTQRSLGEPGDEAEEIGWMQGLSSRLSAYSLDSDPSEAGEPADDDADDSDSREDAD